MEENVLVFSLSWGEGISDKNDESDFEILPHFEAATAGK